MTLSTQTLRACIVAVGCFVLAACQTVPSDQTSDLDEGVRLFNELAFAVDVNRRATHPYISRLPAKFSVSILELQNASQEMELRQNLDQFASLTGTEIEWLPQGNRNAFMQVHYTKDRNFVINRNEPANCYTHAQWRQEGPGTVQIYVGVDGNGQTQVCITHELMHAFGFPGHSFRKPNALNLALDSDTLTNWDRLLLKTLYHPRLTMGMERQTALPIARDIMMQLVSQEAQL